jgi:hypothetical protein
MKNIDYPSFKAAVDNLFKNKNIKSEDNVAVERFMMDFEAHAFTRHAEFGDGMKMLELLNDPASLFDGSNFNKNFTRNLNEFVSAELSSNKTFRSVIKVLTTNKSKGVGIGELVLPLLVSGWVRTNGSDGTVLGEQREVKNGEGASLKPIKKGLVDQGIIDTLNKKYFGGMVLGKKNHSKIIEKYGDFSKDVYKNYFSELWPTANVPDLIESLKKVGSDVEAFNSVVGRFILKEYQKIDGWKSIVLVDPKTLDVVNICDVNDDTCFDKLRFTVRFSREKDTQAVPDGYAVVKLTRLKKSREKKVDKTAKV